MTRYQRAIHLKVKGLVPEGYPGDDSAVACLPYPWKRGTWLRLRSAVTDPAKVDCASCRRTAAFQQAVTT